MKRKRRLIAALVAILLTAAGLVAVVGYVDGAEDRAFRGTQTRQVWQVTAPIPVGTDAAGVTKLIEQVKLPIASIPEGSVVNLGDLKGKVTNASLEPGEQLIMARFASPDEKEEVQDKSAVPDGLQEITVSLVSARIVGKKIKVGDTVGVFGSYDPPKATKLFANRILVTAISAPPAQDAADQQAARLVTLAVSSEVAAKIVNASEFGRVWLTKQTELTDVSTPKTDVEGVLK